MHNTRATHVVLKQCHGCPADLHANLFVHKVSVSEAKRSRKPHAGPPFQSPLAGVKSEAGPRVCGRTSVDTQQMKQSARLQDSQTDGVV